MRKKKEIELKMKVLKKINTSNINKKGLSIIWVSFHEEGSLALKAIIQNGYNLKAIITLKNNKSKVKSGFHDYSVYGKKHNIPCFFIEHINDKSSIEIIKKLNPKLMIVLGWSQILSSVVLNLPEIGVIGAHASLLPKNKGSAPINWTLINGEKRSGNTLMLLDETVDSGAIIAQEAFDITDFDTCRTLYQKVKTTNKSMILKVLNNICENKLVVSPQTIGNKELLPRRKPSDGKIDWCLPGRKIYDFIRALVRPYPGAFSQIKKKKITFWECSFIEMTHSFQQGECLGAVIGTTKNTSGQCIAVTGGLLIVHSISINDKDELKGHHLSKETWKGDYFE